METESVYDPRVIMITGGAGFIGSHVAIRMVKSHPETKVSVGCAKVYHQNTKNIANETHVIAENEQVVVYDSLEYCASLRNLESVMKCSNFSFVKGDIKSADLLRHVIKSEGIDTIMHFAAQTHVDNSFGNSIEFTVCSGLTESQDRHWPQTALIPTSIFTS
jgi:dTDP-D-glucose 4,6-dehydratase